MNTPFGKAPSAFLLTLFSIVLVSIGVIAPEAGFHPAALGIFGQSLTYFSIPYLAGVLLVSVASVVAWTKEVDLSGLCAIQVLLLVSYLWLIPYMMGITLSPGVIGLSRYDIYTTPVLSGHTTPVGDLWQQSWPGLTLLVSSFVELTGIGRDLGTASNLVLLLPFLWQLAYSLVVLLIARRFLPGNKVFAAVWVFLCGNWIGQSYLEIQSLGWYFFLTIVLLIVSHRSSSNTIALGLVLVASSIVHPLSSLMILMTMILLARQFGIAPRILIVALVVTCAYEIFGAYNFWRGGAPGILVGIEEFLKSGLTPPIGQGLSSPTMLHSTVVQMQTLYVAIFGIVSIISVILGLCNPEYRPFYRFCILLLAGIAVVSIGLSNGFGGEILERAYLFGLLPLSLAIAGAMNHRFRRVAVPLVLGFLLIALPLNLFIQYAPEQTFAYSPSYLATGDFFAKYSIPGIFGPDSLSSISNRISYALMPTQGCEHSGPCEQTLPEPEGTSAEYFTVSERYLSLWHYTYSNEPISIWIDSLNTGNRIDLTYSTAGTWIYYYRG